MAVTAFMTFFDKAEGESTQRGKEKWVEIQNWDWELAADTSWTRGGGASVGKPHPGSLNFEHHFDSASIVILGYICTGKAFPKVELNVIRPSARGAAETYFAMTLEGAFITKVSNSAAPDGPVVQRVAMIFKTVKIEYKPQDPRTGTFGGAKTFNWDIPAGTASPSA